jgi:hypothetical protein
VPTYSAVAQPTIVIAVALAHGRVAEQCSRLDATYLTVQPLHAKKLPRAEATAGARLAVQNMLARPSGAAFPLKTGSFFFARFQKEGSAASLLGKGRGKAGQTKGEAGEIAV